jgi:hypothetical protein
MLSSKLALVLWACLPAVLVSAEDRVRHGLIGYGISMYKPVCAFACRDALATSALNCTEPMDMSDMAGMKMVKRMDMGEAETTPECYASDPAFLSTLAYCMGMRCKDETVWDLEEYWNMNVAGDQVDQPVPKDTYGMTLMAVTTKPNETLVVGDPLNKTMLVSDDSWTASANGLLAFEGAEVTHSTYGYVAEIVLPFRFS